MFSACFESKSLDPRDTHAPRSGGLLYDLKFWTQEFSLSLMLPIDTRKKALSTKL